MINLFVHIYVRQLSYDFTGLDCSFFFQNFCLPSRLVQIFPGNSDNNVHKKNLFEPPLFARFVRILPWEWHERITLRVELLGCDE